MNLPILFFKIVLSVLENWLLLFTQSCPILCNPKAGSMPGFPVLRHHPVMPSSHLILCHPFSSCLQSFPASGSFLMSLLFVYWSFSFGFSISPSHEYSGLISFRIYWFDLLAVQETPKSFLQHHNSRASSSSVLSLLCALTLTSIHD